MSPADETIVELPLGLIERGFFQAREYFSPEAMDATKRSIQDKGQKYPVIVRPILPGNPLFDPTWADTHYELADGERRFRCCRDLGFLTLKALIRPLADEEMLDHVLTTNDSLPLNPIEKATVFSRLIKEFGKSQAEVAESFNLKQQQVSEFIRLLDLPKEIQDLTARAVISMRHARELLKIKDPSKIKSIVFEIEQGSLSTRKLSEFVKSENWDNGSSKSEVRDAKKSKKDSFEDEVIDIRIEKEAINNEIAASELNNTGNIDLYSAKNRLNFTKNSEKSDFQPPKVKISRFLPNISFWSWVLSLFGGLGFAVLALWLPKTLLAGLLGGSVTLIFYLLIGP